MTDTSAVTDVFGDGAPDIYRYVDILADRGVSWGLLGPREADRLWDRHILNSAALASVVPSDTFVIDVGSGAGLPGIPLAIARPDLTVTLLEPMARRAQFLELAVAELGLDDRVRVVRARAEEHHEVYDVATCRAVAALPKLLNWTAPLFAGGQLLALKGERVHQELDDAQPELRRRGLVGDVLEVRAHPDTDLTYVARIR